MVESSDKTFAEDLRRAGSRAVVVFWAGWARNCRELADFYAAAGARLDGVSILTLNTDTNPLTAHAYHVVRVPTVAIVGPPGVLWRAEGPPDVDTLVSAWQSASLCRG